MTIQIKLNRADIPASKLADAELVFEDGPLAGLKLVGFAIWQGRDARHVTFPSRAFVINGERRSTALLRPVKDADADAQERLRAMVLLALSAFEQTVRTQQPLEEQQ